MHAISCPVCEPTNQFVVKLVIVEIESTAISCFIIENLGVFQALLRAIVPEYVCRKLIYC